MDSGAYGSYPKRRRYGMGRFLKKKYGSRRAYGRKVNPVNQFTYNKTRIGKYTKTQLVSSKCTYNDRILLLASVGSDYVFQNGFQYLNLSDILAGSPEFISRFTQYSYFMVNGIAVSYSRRWFNPVSFGVDGVNAGFKKHNLGLSRLSTNFYPNLKTTVVGVNVPLADSSWDVSPFITGNQNHYQPFPKNFTTGSNSLGLGVWNACSAYASISGELAINNDVGTLVSNVEAMYIFDVEIQVYVAFCNNTGG